MSYQNFSRTSESWLRVTAVALICWTFASAFELPSRIAFAQEPAAEGAPATEGGAPAAEEEFNPQKLSKQVSDLGELVKGMKASLELMQKGTSDLRKEFNEFKVGPGAAAKPAAPAAAGGLLPAVALKEGEEPKEDTSIVPKSFWTVENSQTLEIYRFEPRILEATKILSNVFAQGAAKIQNATTPEEVEGIPKEFRDMFLDELKESGRTDKTIATWENVGNHWFKEVAPKLEGKMLPEYKETLRAAFAEAAENVKLWGIAIDESHDANRGVAGGGQAAGTGGSGGVSSGGGGASSYSGNYLPPFAAFHHSVHVRRVNRLESRIRLYGGR